MNTGIYEIVNTVNGKRYVGSSINLQSRWAEHKRCIRKRIHCNISIQRAFDKYGEAAFQFKKLIVCSKENLIFYEQQAIDALQPEYNIAKFAGNTLGVIPGPETRAKMSAKLLGNTRTRGVKFSREICERMAAPKRGRKRPPFTEEHKRNISLAKKGCKPNGPHLVSSETRLKIAKTLTMKVNPLTDEQVREIRMRGASTEARRIFAAKFNLSMDFTVNVFNRIKYFWVKD